MKRSSRLKPEEISIKSKALGSFIHQHPLGKITILAIIVLLVKLGIMIQWADFQRMTQDEESNYEIATNYLDGKNYINRYGELSAFHGSFTVFVYQFLIKNKIQKRNFITLIHILGIFVFLVSVFIFYLFLRKLGVNKNVSIASTAIYSLYPSNLFHIGNLFLYEKLGLPLLIILVYLLMEFFKWDQKSKWIWFLPFIVTLSCLVRAQLILIYLIIFISFGLYGLATWKDQEFKNQKILLYIATPILMILSHLPLFAKNQKIFGEYILSTQFGYELMQGHNDLARGSFYGLWSKDFSPYYHYSKKHIPNLDELNEYEEGMARKDFAINWILNNPGKELILIIRKTAIFFLPKNFMGGFNPINLFVHLAFVLALGFAVFKRRMDANSWLILLPILATYLLCLIFFVGLRWRYYAEPFFILFASYHLVSIFSKNPKWFLKTGSKD